MRWVDQLVLSSLSFSLTLVRWWMLQVRPDSNPELRQRFGLVLNKPAYTVVIWKDSHSSQLHPRVVLPMSSDMP